MNVILLGIWLIAPLFWQLMLKSAGLKFTEINIPSFTILTIYVFQYVGWPLLYFNLDEFRSEISFDHFLLTKALLLNILSITMLIVGFNIGKKTFGNLNWSRGPNRFRNENESIALQETFSPSLHHTSIFLYFLILCSFSTVLLYIQTIGFENLAILVALNFVDSELPIAVARTNMITEAALEFHWYKLIIEDFAILVCFAVFADLLIRKKLYIFIIFAMLFLYTSIVLILATQKAPLAYFFLGLFLVHCVVNNSGNMLTRVAPYFVITLLALLSVSYLIFTSESDFLNGVLSVLSRVFTGQLQATYLYVDYFENHSEFYFGKTLPNPGGIFDWENIKLSRQIYEKFMSKTDLGIVGTMPTIFWGELYGNFGFFGVFFGSFIIGFIIYSFNAIVFKFGSSSFSISFFIWSLLHLKNISVTAAVSLLFDIRLFLSFCMFIFISCVVENRKFALLKN